MSDFQGRGLLLLSLVLAVVVAPGVTLAATGVSRPAVLDFHLDPVDQVPILKTASIDASALSARDAQKDAAGAPYQFAIPRTVSATLDNGGRWERPTPLHRIWRLRIQAPGALSVNLGFSVCDLPDGGQLALYPTDLTGPQDPRGVRIFHAGDQDRLGQLWTPVVLADDIMVELMVPVGQAAARLTLAAVNQGYRFFGEPAVQDKSGTCNIDVVCPQGDPWRDEINAVGVYTIDGAWKCSGSLINNARQDGRPLFLTAYHCSSSMNIYANRVVVYWNFRSPVCGQHGGGSLDDFQAGAIFRATFVTSDFTLIELDDPLNPDFGCTLAGWDRRDVVPSSAVAIHYPETDEESISFENDSLSVTTYLGAEIPGDGTHLRVTDWDLGTTEPGSSGSPLFDPDHHIVGQLHGGYASCLNNLSDYYGRLFVSWEGGDTADSRLRDWLDPDGTGVETLDLLAPGRATLTVTPQTGLSFVVTPGGEATPASGSYFLDNGGNQSLEFQVTADQTWLNITPDSGVLDPGVSREVVVIPQAVPQLTWGRYTVTLTFHNVTNGLGDTTRPVVLDVLPSRLEIVRVAPNPFAGYTMVDYVLPAAGPVMARVYDVRGRRVRDFAAIAGVQGANQLAWDGKDNRDREVATGVYIVRLKFAGATANASVTHAP